MLGAMPLSRAVSGLEIDCLANFMNAAKSVDECQVLEVKGDIFERLTHFGDARVDVVLSAFGYDKDDFLCSAQYQTYLRRRCEKLTSGPLNVEDILHFSRTHTTANKLLSTIANASIRSDLFSSIYAAIRSVISKHYKPFAIKYVRDRVSIFGYSAEEFFMHHFYKTTILSSFNSVLHAKRINISRLYRTLIHYPYALAILQSQLAKGEYPRLMSSLRPSSRRGRSVNIKASIILYCLGPLPTKCVICLAYTSTKKFISLECGHIFHKMCIIEWLKDHTTCPCCREKVVRKNIYINL